MGRLTGAMATFEADLVRAVQVELMKPMLKAPKTKRLKLKYYKLLSSFTFRFNLRRCNLEAKEREMRRLKMLEQQGQRDKVRRCRLTLRNPR